jgi:hypothetical protein
MWTMNDVRPAAAAGASRRELMIHELLTSSRSDGGAAAMFALEIVVSMAVRYIRGGVPAGWVCTRWRCIHRLIGIDRAVLPLFCARVCIDGIVFYHPDVIKSNLTRCVAGGTERSSQNPKYCA